MDTGLALSAASTPAEPEAKTIRNKQIDLINSLTGAKTAALQCKTSKAQADDWWLAHFKPVNAVATYPFHWRRQRSPALAFARAKI
jgi:hypothetical protein